MKHRVNAIKVKTIDKLYLISILLNAIASLIMLYFNAKIVATFIYAAVIALATVGFCIYIHEYRKRRNAEKDIDESQ
jgi:NADH:ubiquinone oxidoreductase subunit K